MAKGDVMSKEKILEILMSSDEYISGQKLADDLGVSRNTIWKHVKSLQEEGYLISSKTNAGYRLDKNTDRLSPSEILRLTDMEDSKLLFFEEIGSTNNHLKEHHDKLSDHTVAVSSRQTMGRGRFGKSFYSPAGSGLYFSVLYKGDKKPDPEYLTIAAALAVSDVMEEYGLVSEIKWVNDVYLQGKKVSGILTEGEVELESGAMKYLILGIGLNVNNREFPDELKDVAGSMKLSGKKDYDMNEVLAKLLRSLEHYTAQLVKKDRTADDYQASVQRILTRYNERLLFKGELVTLSGGNRKDITGQLLGINDHGHLKIQTADGIKTAVYGEYQLTIPSR